LYGKTLALGEQGEILVRGPTMMKGYLNRPDATAQTINAGGWLRTCDVGYTDADGDFYIVERAKELIKYNGLQVAPAKLEAVILGHPAVAEAAVRHPRRGDRRGAESLRRSQERGHRRVGDRLRRRARRAA
jgi:long-subunit acyl-CoA synthetase (AMP-forming)